MSKTILIVDDEKINRVLIKKIISRINDKKITIIEAETGSEAVSLLEKHKFDVVLLDLLLPDVNGTTLIKKILQNNKEIKLFIVSALSKKEAGLNGLLSKNVKYISKPFDINFFKESLQEALSNEPF